MKAAQLAFYISNLPVAQSAKDDRVINDKENDERILSKAEERALSMRDEVSTLLLDGSLFDEQENAPLFSSGSNSSSTYPFFRDEEPFHSPNLIFQHPQK